MSAIIDFDGGNVFYGRMAGIFNSESLYSNVVRFYGNGFVFFLSVIARITDPIRKQPFGNCKISPLITPPGREARLAVFAFRDGVLRCCGGILCPNVIESAP